MTKTGRVLYGSVRGEPLYEDFTPKRMWFYTDKSPWRCPAIVWTGADEAGNPTVAIMTWAGTVVFVRSLRLRSSTSPEFEKWFMSHQQETTDDS